MKAEEYLRQLKNLDDLLKSLRAELETANHMLGVKGMRYSDAPFAGGNASDRTSDEAINIANIGEELEKQLKKYIDLKLTAIRLINEMEDVRYKTVLYNYYIQNRTLVETAAEMHRSYQNICVLRKAAIAAFQSLMDLHGIDEQNIEARADDG